MWGSACAAPGDSVWTTDATFITMSGPESCEENSVTLGPTIKEIMEMGGDGLGSDNVIPEGQFSRLEAERAVEA